MENINLNDVMKELRSLVASENPKAKKTLEGLLKNLDGIQKNLEVREAEVSAAEAKRDAGYAEQNAVQKERLAREVSKAMEHLENQKAESFQEYREVLDRKQQELNQKAGALDAREDVVAQREAASKEADKHAENRSKELEEQYQSRMELLDEKSRKLDARSDKLDEEAQEIAEEKIEDERERMLSQIEDLKLQKREVLKALQSRDESLNVLEQLQARLGDKNPFDVLAELTQKYSEFQSALKDLDRKSQDRSASEEFERLKRERDTLEKQIQELNQTLSENSVESLSVPGLKHAISKLQAEKNGLEAQVESLQLELEKSFEDNKRLLASYATPQGTNDRYGEIEMPQISMETLQARDEKWNRPEKIDKKASSEIAWLQEIAQKCADSGFVFSDRILYSYHTALKTAELSPITVLAGVSGTGKSELPRLYSRFGGLNFQSLAVQPNWDSQESMLGFFNSIDNRFDAQPVLKFLAQSQKDPGKTYPGLKNSMNMILLDEMNLAHPELYFAEFLSKLEQRRSCEWGCEPAIDVKIGSGLEPYKLTLGRNVLWTGTMNQDETTKSLSDKVLDRSNVIYFPRPRNVVRRKTVKAESVQESPLLSVATWKSWLSPNEFFKDEEIEKYVEFVNEVNEHLGTVGRALGHRVWQSIEYYMANYPEVRSAREAKDKELLRTAMHKAFEDQIVQKIMPKLRGLDTEGQSKKLCLDPIGNMLRNPSKFNMDPFNLEKDFKNACTFGYGQFMWQTAEYLNG